MAEKYHLYYWALPFRANFIEFLLNHAGVTYRRFDHDATFALKARSVDLDFSGMAPPYLYDVEADVYINQMPAILYYLSHKHGYWPAADIEATLAMKLILDCNDFLADMTNANGSQMWVYENWRAFRHERMANWFRIFDKSIVRFTGGEAMFCGVTQPNVADIAISATMITLMRGLPDLAKDVAQHAPNVNRLVHRMAEEPGIAEQLAQQTEMIYCGGQIEQSIRTMLDKDVANGY